MQVEYIFVGIRKESPSLDLLFKEQITEKIV